MTHFQIDIPDPFGTAIHRRETDYWLHSPGSRIENQGTNPLAISLHYMCT